jgi:hypothetical protein
MEQNYSSKKIGDFRLEHEGAAIICNSGTICIDTKDGKGDFSISYHELDNMVKLDPSTESYEQNKQIVLSLAQAKNRKRLQDVGTVETIYRTIEFGDKKRHYPEMPETFGELVSRNYSSEAWDAKELEILENGENNDGDS